MAVSVVCRILPEFFVTKEFWSFLKGLFFGNPFCGWNPYGLQTVEESKLLHLRWQSLHRQSQWLWVLYSRCQHILYPPQKLPRKSLEDLERKWAQKTSYFSRVKQLQLPISKAIFRGYNYIYKLVGAHLVETNSREQKKRKKYILLSLLD